MMEHTFFAAIGITFIFTVLTILVLKKWANKIRLVDMPGGRKQHALPTPIVGGIAMFIGLYAGLVYLPTVFLPYRSFMVIGMFILIVGILDDLHDISARIRLALQLVAVSFMIFWGHVCLEQLGGLFSEATFYLGYMAVPITLFGAATLINAVNMLDGIDGLAGSLSLIAFISLAAIASYSGQHQTALVLMLFSTAVLAYLVFNFPWWPARKAVVFMGDAGSTLLGFALAWFTIDLSQSTTSIASPAIMLWVVMVPIMDLATVFIKRIRKGRSPFKPGNDHIQDSLIKRGLSRCQAVWVIAGFAVLGQCIAWIMIQYQVPDSGVFSSFIVLFLIYLYWNLRKLPQTC